MYFRVKVDTYVEFPLLGLNMNRYMLNNIVSVPQSEFSNTIQCYLLSNLYVSCMKYSLSNYNLW